MAIKDIVDVFESPLTRADLKEKYQLINKAVALDPHFVYPLETFYDQYQIKLGSIKTEKQDQNIPALIDFLRFRAGEMKKQIIVIKH